MDFIDTHHILVSEDRQPEKGWPPGEAHTAQCDAHTLNTHFQFFINHSNSLLFLFIYYSGSRTGLCELTEGVRKQNAVFCCSFNSTPP